MEPCTEDTNKAGLSLDELKLDTTLSYEELPTGVSVRAESCAMMIVKYD
jgi:hypothetical protein